MKKKESKKQIKRREEREFWKSLKGMTQEEKIAANKARVAKFHPEPDMSRFSTVYRRELSKIKFEKEMEERMKDKWVSIVSIPMKG